MGTDNGITFRDYEEIRKIADEFLARYNPLGITPVPIEEIAEFQLKLDIIPILGLQKVIETDGFTYGDQSAIAVDEFIYNGRLSRYRFTLAHEIGHIVMHSQYFRHQVNSIDKWQVYIDSIPDEQYSMMEYQAYCFAGLVLVPTNKLMDLIPSVIDGVKKIGIYSELPNDFVWDIVKSRIASLFNVSKQVVHKRMEKDNLYNRFNCLL